MKIELGMDVRIHPSARIEATSGYIGDRTVIEKDALIQGQEIYIGVESFIDEGAVIGGGSCFDSSAFLVTGDWFHLGKQGQINTARGVTIGHEVGCGIRTSIFTHGAYLDSYHLGAVRQWGPVTIGDNVWIPNAWINPNVSIGSNVTIAASSLVNQDIPDGALAGGIPAKILKESYLPQHLDSVSKRNLIHSIIQDARGRRELNGEEFFFAWNESTEILEIGFQSNVTLFDFIRRRIDGSVNDVSIAVKDQLRRNGIRFRYCVVGQEWICWEKSGYNIPQVEF
jgi:acetyltransferase-like isoleucine patch superfamily enzyme